MSALDGRIRHLAREEAAALLDSIKSPSAEMAATGGTVKAGVVQQEVAELRATVERLTGRLDELEKATQEKPAPRRTARKETSE